MIDCHTHILPNLDDGSDSMDKTIHALRQMSEGGITGVFCTSHYMLGMYEYSYADYMAKFREVEAEVKTQEIDIELYPGAEIYITQGLSQTIKDHHLTLADSNYILVETDLNGFPPDLHKNLYQLLRDGYKPILAHAERYVSVMLKSHEAKELINRSVYIQVSAPSAIGGYGEKVKQTAWKLLNRGWVHFLGSDHHAKSDYGAFFEAKDKIIRHIDNQAAKLITETHPQAILSHDRIEYEYVYVHDVPKHKYRLS